MRNGPSGVELGGPFSCPGLPVSHRPDLRGRGGVVTASDFILPAQVQIEAVVAGLPPDWVAGVDVAADRVPDDFLCILPYKRKGKSGMASCLFGYLLKQVHHIHDMSRCEK